VKRYVGAYYAEMGGADAIVFSGGIGENAAQVRSRVCQGLDALGLSLDDERNARMNGGAEGEISADGARLKAYVIPTNEELLIARDSYRVVTKTPHPAVAPPRVSRALRGTSSVA
jgi:acetate kinase